MSILKNIKATFIAFTVYIFFSLLKKTWHLSEAELPEDIKEKIRRGEPVVFGHLHEDEWAFLGFYSHRRMLVLVSHSDDGNVMTRFLKFLGFVVARGSSTRGGVMGFLELLRNTQNVSKKTVSLAVDGPKGPRGVVKKGLLKLSQSLNAPIVVGSVSMDKAWILKKSWAQTLIPKPFARIRAEYFCIPPISLENDQIFDREAQKLSEKLQDAKRLARQKLYEKSL